MRIPVSTATCEDRSWPPWIFPVLYTRLLCLLGKGLQMAVVQYLSCRVAGTGTPPIGARCSPPTGRLQIVTTTEVPRRFRRGQNACKLGRRGEIVWSGDHARPRPTRMLETPARDCCTPSRIPDESHHQALTRGSRDQTGSTNHTERVSGVESRLIPHVASLPDRKNRFRSINPHRYLIVTQFSNLQCAEDL
jgi:hypothetical protein